MDVSGIIHNEMYILLYCQCSFTLQKALIPIHPSSGLIMGLVAIIKGQKDEGGVTSSLILCLSGNEDKAFDPLRECKSRTSPEASTLTKVFQVPQREVIISLLFPLCGLLYSNTSHNDRVNKHFLAIIVLNNLWSVVSSKNETKSQTWWHGTGLWLWTVTGRWASKEILWKALTSWVRSMFHHSNREANQDNLDFREAETGEGVGLRN